MAPVMISMLFRSMKPAVQPLSPEKAFRTEITTGMVGAADGQHEVDAVDGGEDDEKEDEDPAPLAEGENTRLDGTHAAVIVGAESGEHHEDEADDEKDGVGQSGVGRNVQLLSVQLDAGDDGSDEGDHSDEDADHHEHDLRD